MCCFFNRELGASAAYPETEIEMTRERDGLRRREERGHIEERRGESGRGKSGGWRKAEGKGWNDGGMEGWGGQRIGRDGGNGSRDRRRQVRRQEERGRKGDMWRDEVRDMGERANTDRRMGSLGGGRCRREEARQGEGGRRRYDQGEEEEEELESEGRGNRGRRHSERRHKEWSEHDRGRGEAKGSGGGGRRKEEWGRTEGMRNSEVRTKGGGRLEELSGRTKGDSGIGDGRGRREVRNVEERGRRTKRGGGDEERGGEWGRRDGDRRNVEVRGRRGDRGGGGGERRSGWGRRDEGRTRREGGREVEAGRATNDGATRRRPEVFNLQAMDPERMVIYKDGKPPHALANYNYCLV